MFRTGLSWDLGHSKVINASSGCVDLMVGKGRKKWKQLLGKEADKLKLTNGMSWMCNREIPSFSLIYHLNEILFYGDPLLRRGIAD